MITRSLLLAALHSAAVCYAGDLPLTLIALSDAEPPGRGPDYKHLEMDAPFVGRNGLVPYSAPVKYVGFQNPLSVNRYKGVYVGTPGAISWSNPGGPYPVTGRSGVFFLPQKPTAANSSGQILGTAAFVDNPAGVFPSLSGYGIVRGTGSTAELIYRDGDPAPEMPGVTLFHQNSSGVKMNINNSGRVTFGALLTNSNGAAIYFTDTPGNLTKVVRTSEPSPGGGGNFTSLGDPATSDDGSIVFGAAVGGGIRNTIWVRSPAGSLAALAQAGIAVPGGSGATFTEIAGASFHLPVRADGSTAFAASYSSGAKKGIFIGKPGQLQTVVTSDQIAPGSGGGNYTLDPTTVADSLRINDSGTLLFLSSWLTPSFTFGSGLYARYQGNFVAVAQSGSAAPGGPAGSTFQTFERYETMLNNRDQIVFRATLTGGGVNSDTSQGIWAHDLATGVTKLILRDSDLVELSPGNTIGARVFYSGDVLVPTSRGGGTGTPLSDDGRFIFKVRLADLRYAIFTTELSPPPPLSRQQQWRLNQYGSSGNSGAGADTAVPGPDSLPNLVRYALGLTAGANGVTNGSAPAPRVESIAGINYPAISFIRDPAATEVRLAVSISENFTTWSEGSVLFGSASANANAHTTEISRVAQPDGRELVTIRSNQSVGSRSRQFMRLTATMP